MTRLEGLKDRGLLTDQQHAEAARKTTAELGPVLFVSRCGGDSTWAAGWNGRYRRDGAALVNGKPRYCKIGDESKKLWYNSGGYNDWPEIHRGNGSDNFWALGSGAEDLTEQNAIKYAVRSSAREPTRSGWQKAVRYTHKSTDEYTRTKVGDATDIIVTHLK